MALGWALLSPEPCERLVLLRVEAVKWRWCLLIYDDATYEKSRELIENEERWMCCCCWGWEWPRLVDDDGLVVAASVAAAAVETPEIEIEIVVENC